MTKLSRSLMGAALLCGLAFVSSLAQTTRQLTPIPAPTAAPTGQPTPPQDPFLRIDADFHTQTVNRFAQDRNGRIIVTASDDKTIRVWQANDGAPLATLRVPIAPGNEGEIFAVAISPDGHTLLAGGYTGYAWDKLFAIYMFDLDSLKLKGRLPGLPGQINDIAYSPDGNSFAVAMGNGGGVWLIDAKNGTTIGSDGVWGDAVTSVQFDAHGRLYATGFAGDVRLYDANGRRLAQRTPVRDGHPYSLAVSPDGRTVAVGYSDEARVELLNANDLSTRATLDTDPSGRKRVRNAGLLAVAWGRDGSLFASGSLVGGDGHTVLRRWGPGGSGKPVDWSGLKDTAFQVGATADGGVIMVGADPALERLDRNGRIVFRNEGPGLDFRDLGQHPFKVSQDGRSVQLQARGMDAPWTVDLGNRKVGPPTATRGLTPIVAPTQDAAPHGTIGIGLDISNWHNSNTPRIADQAIQLDPDELSRSYAAAPSGQLIVLGTDYRLRVYRRDGAPLGQIDLPGPAWAVGVSGDGQVVVAAVGDGTLRWFGLSAAGQLTPRVSLFPAADAKRWVAWTPEGFFDYSDLGGEGMVGVLLNHARNQVPEWFSFAQVYRRFYSPQTVAAELRGERPTAAANGGGGGGGVTEVRQRLAQTPPPGIELRAVCWNAPGGRQCQQLAASSVTRSLTVIATPGQAAPEQAAGDATVPDNVSGVVLQYRLKGVNGTSSAVDLFVNDHNEGREMRQVSATGDPVYEQSASIDAGVNKIQLRAYDKDEQTYAQSRVLQVSRPAAPQAKLAKPTLYVLAAGINKYGPKVGELRLAVTDARSVVAAFKQHLPDAYGRIETIELYDKDASKENVLAALAKIGAEATSDDTTLIYLSGHGVTLDSHYYFITQNVPSAVIPDITGAAVSETMLINGLASIKSNNTMLFLDTCHAGAFSLDAVGGNIAHETGRYVLAAAASVEEALDSYDDKNGVFATAVLRGLSGKAAEGKKVINNFELGFYVQPLVHQLATEADPDHSQSAFFKIAADNAVPFPVAEEDPAKAQ